MYHEDLNIAVQEMTTRRVAGEDLVTIRYDMKWDGYSEEEIDTVVSQLPAYDPVPLYNRSYRRSSLAMCFIGLFIALMSLGILWEGSLIYKTAVDLFALESSPLGALLSGYTFLAMGLCIALLGYRNYSKDKRST
jgi:hypothetical protein